MRAINRDDTEHGVYYYKASEVDALLAAQAAKPAPRRLTEAEITLLVEAYYADHGSAPPDLIKQAERVIFGGGVAAQPAEARELSDDEIHALANDNTPNTETGSLNYMAFARAVTAAINAKENGL